MSVPPRGRGYAITKAASAQPLRRPAETGLKQRFGSVTPNGVSEYNTEDKINLLCSEICKMNLSEPKKEFAAINEEVLALCDSSENLKNFVDKITAYALKSKWNAHAIALFCENYGDISANDAKLRTLLLRKLQQLYLEREKSFLNKDKFCMDVRFLCEIFFHITIEGNCITVLAHPITEVLSMLVEGGSQPEIEVFYEQFPKCFKNLKDFDSKGIDDIMSKMRKQLLSEKSTVATKTMLLEMFELVLSDGLTLSSDVRKFYDSLSVPAVRICK